MSATEVICTDHAILKIILTAHSDLGVNMGIIICHVTIYKMSKWQNLKIASRNYTGGRNNSKKIVMPKFVPKLYKSLFSCWSKY